MANKILFIEDDLRLVETYDFLFTKEGYQLAWANNGEDGLRKADEFQPDLIVLDMMMPLMSGLEFLERYDAKTKHPGVKIIAFSNMQTDEFIHQAMELGVAKYEIKSTFPPRKLVELVQELIGNPA